MKKMIMKKFMIIFSIILSLLLIQSCNHTYPLPICSHPWIVVGFSSESIGTQTGDITVEISEEWIIQIGLEPFDSIAKEHMVMVIKQMYSSNNYPKNFLSQYGVYPMNVFLIELGEPYYSFDDAIESFKKDLNVLYLDSVNCTKSRCHDNLKDYKSK